MKKICRKQGIFTLEAMLVTICATPIFIALVVALHRSLTSYLKARLEDDEQYKLSKIRSIISTVVDDIDSSTLRLEPRIHKKATISFTDGTPNTVTNSASAPPHSDHVALTSARLDILKSQSVRTSVVGPAIANYIACPKYGEILEKNMAESLLGISVDGMCELSGAIAFLPDNPSCAKLDLKKQRSMIVPAAEIDLGTIRMLIPFRSIYTIYVDQNSQLRYLSHQGGKNIENQPLLSGINQLDLGLHYALNNQLLILESKFKFNSPGDYSLSVAAHLGREDFYDLLLNRP